LKNSWPHPDDAAVVALPIRAAKLLRSKPEGFHTLVRLAVYFDATAPGMPLFFVVKAPADNEHGRRFVA